MVKELIFLRWVEWAYLCLLDLLFLLNVCEIFYKDKKKLNSNLISQIKKELKIIEKDVNKKFGDLKNPSASIS